MADQEEVQQPSTEEVAILTQAKAMGYKEDYEGANKLTPQEYVSRAFERLDIAKGSVKTLLRKNEELSSDNKKLLEKLDRMGLTMKQFVESSRKTEERAYQRARAELEAKMEKAVEDADTDAYKKSKAQLDKLDQDIKEHPALTGKEVEEKEEKPAKQAEWYSPDIQEKWLEANDWYEKDMDMAVYANSIDQVLSKTRKGQKQSQEERLEAITEAVKEKFPERFGLKPKEEKVEKAQRKGGAVEGGGNEGPAGGTNGHRTYANLTPEAKRYCDEFVADKLGTKEDYVRLADDSLFHQ